MEGQTARLQWHRVVNALPPHVTDSVVWLGEAQWHHNEYAPQGDQFPAYLLRY